MKLRLYCIYDRKMNVYFPPITATNEEHAKRKFSEIFNTTNSLYLNYPEDFEVWFIGYFNDSLGKIEKAPANKLIGTAKNLVGRRSIEDTKHALFNDKDIQNKPQPETPVNKENTENA
jgi:hypothetical protein